MDENAGSSLPLATDTQDADPSESSLHLSWGSQGTPPSPEIDSQNLPSGGLSIRNSVPRAASDIEQVMEQLQELQAAADFRIMTERQLGEFISALDRLNAADLTNDHTPTSPAVSSLPTVMALGDRINESVNQSTPRDPAPDWVIKVQELLKGVFGCGLVINYFQRSWAILNYVTAEQAYRSYLNVANTTALTPILNEVVSAAAATPSPFAAATAMLGGGTFASIIVTATLAGLMGAYAYAAGSIQPIHDHSEQVNYEKSIEGINKEFLERCIEQLRAKMDMLRASGVLKFGANLNLDAALKSAQGGEIYKSIELLQVYFRGMHEAVKIHNPLLTDTLTAAEWAYSTAPSAIASQVINPIVDVGEWVTQILKFNILSPAEKKNLITEVQTKLAPNLGQILASSGPEMTAGVFAAKTILKVPSAARTAYEKGMLIWPATVLKGQDIHESISQFFLMLAAPADPADPAAPAAPAAPADAPDRDRGRATSPSPPAADRARTPELAAAGTRGGGRKKKSRSGRKKKSIRRKSIRRKSIRRKTIKRKSKISKFRKKPHKSSKRLSRKR